MWATCLSTQPSSSSSSITAHTRASPPYSKRLLSWPSYHHYFSQPIRLRRRGNTTPTPVALLEEVPVTEEEEPDDVVSDRELAQMFKPFGTAFSIEALCCNGTSQIQPRKPPIRRTFQNPKTMAVSILGIGTGLALTLVGPASAAELPFLQLSEPSNALSLPTWAIHVSSVVEWITAMALVWQYGEKSGNEPWKGLSWGMVPLLGGAFCACTWHFFYNSESLEVLVALQAALTVIGNATMCYAAFRIFKASEERSKNNL